MPQSPSGRNAGPYRLAVPRGNEWVRFTPLPLDYTSPHWSLLTPDEQRVAAETAHKRPVMTLAMAGRTIRECLIDLRLARTVGEWRKLSGRLERVKGAFFGEETDEAIRRTFLAPLRVRFMLLGAAREEAERNAPELVDAVLQLRAVGTWHPPAAFPPLGENPDTDIRECLICEEHDGAQRQWAADAKAIRAAEKDWIEQYKDEELRAFPDDPPPDPFLKSRGERIERLDYATPSASSVPCPPGFTRTAVEHATRHVQELLSLAARLLHPVRQSEPTTDTLLFMAKHFDALIAKLPSGWYSPELCARMNRIRSVNYEIGGLVRRSVHEAVEELARQVCFAARAAVGQAVDPDGKEHDRMTFGPYRPHEMAGAIPRLQAMAPALLQALDSIGRQRMECDLQREAATLCESADREALTVNASTPPAAGAVSANGSKPSASHLDLIAKELQTSQRIETEECESLAAWNNEFWRHGTTFIESLRYVCGSLQGANGGRLPQAEWVQHLFAAGRAMEAINLTSEIYDGHRPRSREDEQRWGLCSDECRACFLLLHIAAISPDAVTLWSKMQSQGYSDTYPGAGAWTHLSNNVSWRPNSLYMKLLQQRHVQSKATVETAVAVLVPNDKWTNGDGELKGDVQKPPVESEGAKLPVGDPSDRPARDPNKPGRDRQNDILATIRGAGTPLTRPELIDAMKLKTEGKLGGNLAWMVTNNFLVNIPQRGYWPAGDSVPEE